MGYDDRTIKHKSFFVRWVHRKRYQGIINLLEKIKPHSVLDYGAGTGSFAVQLLDFKWTPEIIAAFEPRETSFQEINDKLRELNLLDRVHLYNNLSEIKPGFDVIACMGVLEHLTFKQRQELYDNVRRLLNPGGYFIMQVPIMIGFSMIFRMLVKILVKKEDLRLSPKEVILAGLLFKVINDNGRSDENNVNTFINTHMGFDHRRLVTELKEHFQMTNSFCGPFYLPYYLAHSFYAVFKV
ncbi:MAG: class I SAM-dependent methyltransferase [Deltaproteobacteria bacterium]|nr:MAG: class I SAM-dependent methyltransferase [Deltaproteobacteria bacterium]